MLLIIKGEFHETRKRQRPRFTNERSQVLHQRRIRRFHGLLPVLIHYSELFVILSLAKNLPRNVYFTQAKGPKLNKLYRPKDL